MEISDTKIILLSPPKNVENEHQIVVHLFEVGLQYFHLRKPDFSDIEYAQYLAEIPTKYWNQIVLHHHHYLAEQLSLGGVHLTEHNRKSVELSALQEKISDYQNNHLSVSAAIHDLKDLDILGQWCDYVLVSPVFDSISKSAYKANPNLDIKLYQGTIKSKLFALGGIKAENVIIASRKGFEGIAALGYVWEKPDEAINRYKTLEKEFNSTVKGIKSSTKPLQQIENELDQPKISLPNARPFVLTFAGHDPSAGAGLTADLKTFEQNEVYGLSVCTALTVQTDIQFEKTNWVDLSLIVNQAITIKNRFPLKAIKIGLIENLEVLEFITSPMFREFSIVFDPILRASAGFEFHSDLELKRLYDYLKHITLITPNREEILRLVPNTTAEKAAQFLSQYCAVLLKGGHYEDRLGEDELWKDGKKIATFEAQQIAKSGKHGSGCVLSAAITSNLAKGQDLIDACRTAKIYIERFLNSNNSLLGYHEE